MLYLYLYLTNEITKLSVRNFIYSIPALNIDIICYILLILHVLVPVFTTLNLLYSAVFVNASVLHTLAFLGAFAKLRKTTASFVMHVSLSVRPSVYMEQLVSYWTNFHKILYFSIFRKSVEKCQVLFISRKTNEYFT